jgi:hypothetical protein
MNFLPDLIPQSFLHVLLLSVLWTTHVYDPVYNWPEDYLTRAPFNCE